jgi:hypothetical protein
VGLLVDRYIRSEPLVSHFTALPVNFQIYILCNSATKPNWNRMAMGTRVATKHWIILGPFIMVVSSNREY